MRVFVTGGAGRVGQAVVAHLVQAGFATLVIDRIAPEQESVSGADFVEGDILDYPKLRELIRGCEAGVHLAAIPNPGSAPNETLFNTNVSGTFNVFQAAAAEGIRRVVQASSINAVGYYYGVGEMALEYLPLDEEHPSSTSDAYSLSKSVVEELGRYFWRRDGISSVALRFPAVIPADGAAWVPNRQEDLATLCERLLSLPPEERLRWFETSRDAHNHLRGQRIFEDGERQSQMWRTDSPVPIDLRLAMGGRYNFFTLIDERDAAQAVEKGLTASYEGSHPLFVNDRSNWTGIDSATLVELFYPDVPRLKKPLVGKESLVSYAWAKALIGFEPEYGY